MNKQREEISQLRQHLRFRLIHRLRLWYYKRQLEHCGNHIFFDKNIEIQRFPQNVSIFDNVVLKEGARICACNSTAHISIGKNSTIGFHTFIIASENIKIGENCLIAPFVYLVDSDHQTKKGTLINQQSNLTAPISVGNDVWIGAGAKILKGVSIGDGAIVAAGAVVTTSIGANEVYGGIPAKKISERK